MKGMKNMAITMNVSSFAKAQINAYRGLAKKATETGGAGSQDSSVVAALKRFFYKLDFLLKYGQFPSVEDTAQDALPPELQELKTFLENPHYEEKSYILQKDANTRYCFSRISEYLVSVCEESRGGQPGSSEVVYVGWLLSIVEGGNGAQDLSDKLISLANNYIQASSGSESLGILMEMMGLSFNPSDAPARCLLFQITHAPEWLTASRDAVQVEVCNQRNAIMRVISNLSEYSLVDVCDSLSFLDDYFDSRL